MSENPLLFLSLSINFASAIMVKVAGAEEENSKGYPREAISQR